MMMVAFRNIYSSLSSPALVDKHSDGFCSVISASIPAQDGWVNKALNKPGVWSSPALRPLLTISGSLPQLSGSNSLHPRSEFSWNARAESHFSISIIWSLSVNAEVRTRCCVDGSAFTQKPLSHRIRFHQDQTGPGWPPQILDFSLQVCTRESRADSRMASAFSAVYLLMHVQLCWHCNLLLSSIIYSPFWIHFHPFPSFSLFGFVVALEPGIESKPSTRPSACRHLGKTFIFHSLNVRGISSQLLKQPLLIFQKRTSAGGWCASKHPSSVTMLCYIVCYCFNDLIALKMVWKNHTESQFMFPNGSCGP